MLQVRKGNQSVKTQTANDNGNTGEKPESRVYSFFLTVQAGNMIIEEFILEKQIGVEG